MNKKNNFPQLLALLLQSNRGVGGVFSLANMRFGLLYVFGSLIMKIGFFSGRYFLNTLKDEILIIHEKFPQILDQRPKKPLQTNFRPNLETQIANTVKIRPKPRLDWSIIIDFIVLSFTFFSL